MLETMNPSGRSVREDSLISLLPIGKVTAMRPSWTSRSDTTKAPWKYEPNLCLEHCGPTSPYASLGIRMSYGQAADLRRSLAGTLILAAFEGVRGSMGILQELASSHPLCGLPRLAPGDPSYADVMHYPENRTSLYEARMRRLVSSWFLVPRINQ